MKKNTKKHNSRGRSGGSKGRSKKTFRGAKDKYNKDNLFKKKKEKKASKESAKKLFCFNRYRDKKYLDEELKKKKILEEKIQSRYESSDSEQEIQDPMQQLLSTFESSGNKGKKSKAVDSSDESDQEEKQSDIELEGENEEELDSDLDEDMLVEGEKDEEENVELEEEEENVELEEEEDENNVMLEDFSEMDAGNQEVDKIKKKKRNSSSGNSSVSTYINEEGDEIIRPGQQESSSPNIENDRDDDESLWNDPFTRHFQDDIHDSLLESISKKPTNVETTTMSWPCLGRFVVQIPKSKQDGSGQDCKPKFSILEKKQYAHLGAAPQRIQSINWNNLCIKKQLQPHVPTANKINLLRRECEVDEIFTPIQKELFSIMNNYQDLYYPERSFVNGEEIRFTYCLHALNHLIKTRTKILHHNAKLSKKSEVPDDYRDQGLVRPKVIIIVPFKDSAYRIIKILIELLVPGDSSLVVNKNRFEQDFTGGELAMPKKHPKPEDYELTFSGNTEDTFRVGLSITKKTLKLYADFYSSDLIITSPLGLRMIVGAEGEEDRESDFLASVELLIMDQAEIFLMQNWDHLLHVLDHFHLQPKKTHGTDFSRLRSWAINGWTKYYRQTLIFSSTLLPEITSIFNNKCFNYAGKIKIVNPVEAGSIRHVAVQVPQVFRRIEAKDPVSSIDTRFEYFVKEVLPQYKDTIMAHTMIYIPSYFDFVRIRNYFKKEDINFVQICEYSKDAKIARARDMFFHSEGHFLLYSERFHFFRRMKIKGIRHVIFYQPPVFPHFYSEICNLMQEANQNKYGGSESNVTVTVLYTKYDLQQLSAVVSTERTSKMCQSDRNVHMFMTGE